MCSETVLEDDKVGIPEDTETITCNVDVTGESWNNLNSIRLITCSCQSELVLPTCLVKID